MAAPSQTVGDRLLLSPREPLLAGGAAEAFEAQIRQLIRGGHRDLVVDLAGVTSIDSAGIRALVRGHTSAQRAGGNLRLAAARPAVSKVLELSHLASIFESYESVEAARFASWPWQEIAVAIGGTIFCAALVYVGLRWQYELANFGEAPAVPVDAASAFFPSGTAKPPVVHPLHAFLEAGKLVIALIVGLLVSYIHHPTQRAANRSLEQAQTLLCVSGAFMMVIIGNSVARAFGVAGIAGIIRFRTPIEDPKDVTVLFLLMGLGMATGLGAFAVTGLGTAFLCLTLLALDQVARKSARVMQVEIVASGRDFPTTHVESVFARNQVNFEPREITQSDDVTIKYFTWLSPEIALEDLSAQLMAPNSGVSGVSWERPKRA